MLPKDSPGIRSFRLFTLLVVQSCLQKYPHFLPQSGLSFGSKVWNAPKLIKQIPQNAMTNNRDKVWPEKILPYKISPDLGYETVYIIDEVMQMIERQTCIRFVTIDNGKPRVSKTSSGISFDTTGGSKCSVVGYDRTVPLIHLNVNYSEFSTSSLLHTMFHVLGRYHEHQRPDRRRFVKIIPENIIEGDEEKFAIEYNVSSQQLQYGFESMMHFRHDAFARSNGLSTIVPLTRDIPRERLGQSKVGTSLDFLHVNLLYCGATSKVIKNLRVESGLDSIRFNWDRPKLRPLKFKLTFSCWINGEEQYMYITNGEQELISTSISVTLGKLRSNSVCKFNLLAVYNPVGIDPGITVTERTLVKERKNISEFYAIGPQLGGGGFGKVYYGTNRRTGEEVAIKTISSKDALDWEKIESDKVPSEIAFLLLLKHKYIINMIDYFTNDQVWYIVMEKPQRYFDLGVFLRRQKYLDENLSRIIIRNLLEAIEYCHSMGVVHRDIKLRNILFHPNTGEIKLIDFGCAESFSSMASSMFKGTMQFLPPETITKKIFFAVPGTVWSVGIVLYRMLQGTRPFETNEEIAAAAVTFKRPIANSAEMLIRWMLSLRPSHRPKIEQIQCHAWIQKNPTTHLPQQPLEERLTRLAVSPPQSPLPSPPTLTIPDNRDTTTPSQPIPEQ